MLNIVILAIGKVKEKYYSEACDEYLKRLKPYAKISVNELKTESFGVSDKAHAKRAEGERIADFIDRRPASQVFVLDENGKEFTSVDFSGKLDETGGEMIFVIGGSLGLSKEILSKPWTKISLSKMTLPHELARVVLLEQIYRAVTIQKGKEYHY